MDGDLVGPFVAWWKHLVCSSSLKYRSSPWSIDNGGAFFCICISSRR